MTDTVTREYRRRAKAQGIHVGILNEDGKKPRVMFWSLSPSRLLVTWHPRNGTYSTDPRAASHHPGTYFKTSGKTKDPEAVLAFAFALRQKEQS